jgi:hypothetical protein
MRTRTGWLALLLTAGFALVPSRGQAQEVPPADPALPIPLYHDRPERGGFYSAYEFVFFRQTNPIKEQLIAVRGFNDVDGTIQLAQSLLTGTPPLNQIVPGQFIGSGAPALDAEQVAGPVSWQPGWRLTAGWRFSDGASIEFRWMSLTETKYNAVASFLPQPVRGTFPVGANLADTFLFSPVFNFPNEFAGSAFKIVPSVSLPSSSANAAVAILPGPPSVISSTVVTSTGNTVTTTTTNIGSVFLSASANQGGAFVLPQAAFGIWNGASIMSLSFVQRHDQYDLVGRWPIGQTECSRWWVTAGARHVSMWERFFWRAVSLTTAFPPTASASATFSTTATPNGVNITSAATANGGQIVPIPGIAGADDVADFTNVVSNQLYGPSISCGSEWYLGAGFSASLELRAAAFLDVIHEIAKYEREDRYIASKRAKREYSIVPELSATANIWWYPIEGVEMRFGYDFMNFFNTAAAPHPVDFNYGAMAPAWDKGRYRTLDGFTAGIAFIF